MKANLLYLASPYSHPDPSVQVSRFQEVCQVASYLMREGLHVFSPIAHTHPIALAGALPTGWDYWKAYDEAMLSTCRALVVLQMDGWKTSTGVQGEIVIARLLNLTTYYVDNDPTDLKVLVDVVRRDLQAGR